MGFLFDSPKVQYEAPKPNIQGLDKLGEALVNQYLSFITGDTRALPYRGYQSMMDPRRVGPSNVEYWNPFKPSYPGASLLQPGQAAPDAGNQPPTSFNQGGAGKSRGEDINRGMNYGGVPEGGKPLFGKESSVVRFIERLFPGYAGRAFPDMTMPAPELTQSVGAAGADEQGSYEPTTSDDIIDDIINQIERGGRVAR
jgi:hypothetical protein